MAIFMHSKEGVTQEYHIVMIAYSIGSLPLIKNIKRDLPNFSQTWYAEDAW